MDYQCLRHNNPRIIHGTLRVHFIELIVFRLKCEHVKPSVYCYADSIVLMIQINRVMKGQPVSDCNVNMILIDWLTIITIEIK